MANPETDKVKNVFSDFFHAMGKPYKSGLPNQVLQKKLEPYFSRTLKKLVHDASQREVQCIAINSRINADIIKKTPKGQPPEILKPAMIEGSIFTLQYETPDDFKVIESFFKNGNAVLIIQYSNYDNYGHKTYYWKNQVVLINETGKWKIDNFFDIPTESENKNKLDDVQSSLKEFPSCTNDYENYEKDNSH